MHTTHDITNPNLKCLKSVWNLTCTSNVRPMSDRCQTDSRQISDAFLKIINLFTTLVEITWTVIWFELAYWYCGDFLIMTMSCFIQCIGCSITEIRMWYPLRYGTYHFDRDSDLYDWCEHCNPWFEIVFYPCHRWCLYVHTLSVWRRVLNTVSCIVVIASVHMRITICIPVANTATWFVLNTAVIRGAMVWHSTRATTTITRGNLMQRRTFSPIQATTIQPSCHFIRHMWQYSFSCKLTHIIARTPGALGRVKQTRKSS